MIYKMAICAQHTSTFVRPFRLHRNSTVSCLKSALVVVVVVVVGGHRAKIRHRM